MDFKIAGSDEGITAMQLDVKRVVPLDIILEALDTGREGRVSIMESMTEGLTYEKSSASGGELWRRNGVKSTAPRVEVVRFDANRKKDLIGPGGAVLRQLEERCVRAQNRARAARRARERSRLPAGGGGLGGPPPPPASTAVGPLLLRGPPSLAPPARSPPPPKNPDPPPSRSAGTASSST